MNPLNIRLYVEIAVIAALLSVVGVSRWELHSVTTEFADYKGNINDQRKQAEIKVAATKAKNDMATEQARVNNLRLSGDLAVALKRLRDIQSLSGHSSLSVAGRVGSIVPTAKDNPSGVDPERITIGTGVLTVDEFYDKAMNEHLTCKLLIEFLR
jgi:hypothetical protein